MRFRSTMLVCSLIALAALGLAGCSDDSPTTATTPAIDNAAYTVVKAEFDNSLDSTVAVFQKGIQLASDVNTGSVNDLGEILFGPMLVDSLVSQNTWHVLFGTSISAGVSRTVIDSVQYSHDGVPQVNPQNANEITIHHYLIQTNQDTQGSYRNIESSATVTLTGLDGDAALINGTQNTTMTTQIVAGDNTTVRDWAVTSEVNDVTIARSSGWSVGCPTSGTTTTTVELTQTVNNGTPASTSWQFDVAFDNGQASITVTLGAQSATYHKLVCQM